MNQDSENVEKLNAEFNLLATKGAEASEQLEQGQAESPEKLGFEKILQSNSQSQFGVSLLSLSTEARSSAEHWIAVHQQQNEKNQQNTRFLLADFKQLGSNPQLNQEFCTSGHLLVVVGLAEHSLGETEVEKLTTLADNFTTIWPWVAGTSSVRTEHSWWNHSLLQSHQSRLDTLMLDEPELNAAELLSFQSTSLLRNALHLEPSVRLLQGAFEVLADRRQREISSLEARNKRHSQKALSMSHKPGTQNDKSVTELRDQFNEELATLEKSISLKSERATQPLGFLTNLMREQVSKLQLEDLDKQQSPSLTKLSINGSHLGAVNRAIEHALRQELSEDVKTIQHQLAELTENAIHSLPGIENSAFQLDKVSLRETEIWRRVENLMAIGKESHIELARKGFFDVLTAGRQKVFILIMFVSLMGRMGLPDLFASGLMRSAFGLFMVSVLIGSMVNAIFVWRREKESQSEKEMSKIKDSLFSDGTKVIEQVEKGKLTFLRDYFRDVSKKFEKELKRAVEEHAIQSKEEAERQAKHNDDIRKKLETRINTLTDAGKQINSLQTDARKLHQKLAGMIRTHAMLFKNRLPSEPDTDSTIVETTPPIVGQEDLVDETAGSSDSQSNENTSPTEHAQSSSAEVPRPVRTSALLARREARRRERAAQLQAISQPEAAQE